MKRVFSIVLMLILLVMLVIPVSAQTPSPKEEVIYGLLNLDGSVKNLYVVNIFDGGAITDYGDYSDIRNLTTSEKLSRDGDKITVNTSADKFYYQGTFENKELPWDIVIKYYLNNKEIPGEELGGKSGALKIFMSIRQNNKVNSTFFDNYALQIAISLDNKLCSNIKSENATIAEAGSKKQLTYTVLPGKEADIVVTADVHDFEMEAISINGIKLALNMDIDISEFKEQLSELANAVKELDDGAAELLDGITQLSDGMQKYINGMKAFKNGLGQFSAGIDKLDAGASLLKNGLSELTNQNEFIMNGALAIQQAIFDSVNAQLTGMGSGLPILTPENYSTILTAIPNLDSVKKQLDGVVQFTQGLKSYLNGVSQINGGASDLALGISEFKISSSTIAASANELYNAGSELNAALRKFRDGLASYKTGTNELREGTSNIDSEMENKINEILADITGNDDKVISFVSDKNTNISAVQFVLRTDSISLPEISKSAKAEQAKLSFWQRFLKLFGLYND